jgi:hypothetical protein
MPVMNQIAIDPQVIENLEATYKDLGFEHPSIDVQKDLLAYIESLEHLDEHERQHRVEAWIKAQITPNLSEWEAKYSQNSDLLHRASSEIQKLEKAKKRDQVNMDNLQSNLGDLEDEKKLKEKEIKSHRKDNEGKKKIDIKYEKMKATILLVFSFLIAIGTYVYFTNTQISINWATMDDSEKTAKVVKLIKNIKSEEAHAGFSGLIKDDDNLIPVTEINDTHPANLAFIIRENIDLASTPSLSDYAQIDFTILILAFSSFLLILMGKITATVYEKLGMPNWMYFIIYGLAILVLIGAVWANSSVDSYEKSKNPLKNEIFAIDKKITTINENEDDGGFSSDFETENTPKIDNPKIIELQNQRKELKVKITELNNSMSSFKFTMMLLFMFAEILVGSLAWISYAEYIDKKIKLSSNGQGLYDILKEELEHMVQEIKTLIKDIAEYQDRIALVSSLEHRLTALKRKLHSKDNIKNIAQEHMEKEIYKGIAKLQIAESKWVKGK